MSFQIHAEKTDIAKYFPSHCNLFNQVRLNLSNKNNTNTTQNFLAIQNCHKMQYSFLNARP
jgi:transcription initiation factor IIE alpha subunit